MVAWHWEGAVFDQHFISGEGNVEMCNSSFVSEIHGAHIDLRVEPERHDPPI